MKEITVYQMEKLYKQQKNLLTAATAISISVFIVNYFLIQALNLSEKLSEHRSIIILISVILAAIPFAAVAVIKNKLIPKGNGRKVREAFSVIQKDVCSDRTINFIYSKISETENYPDQIMLKLFLVDLFDIRGQYAEAIEIINSIDRSKFDRFPNIGMSFYGDVMSIYDHIGDYESVIAAFNDAEPFIEKCSNMNYVCCSGALNIEIIVEKARKNYRKALELRLMKNEFENRINKTIAASQQRTSLAGYLRGCVFYETAELFYLCGDMENSGKNLDIGGSMLAISPSATERANKLSALIRSTSTVEK